MNPVIEMKAFGVNLRRLRTEKRMSQNSLASVLGVRQSAINNIEKGRNNQSLRLAQKDATYFGVTLNDLAAPVEATPCQN